MSSENLPVEKAERSILKMVMKPLKAIDWKNVKPAVYARYVAAIVIIVNIVLQYTGLNPLPFSSDDVYRLGSDILGILILVVNTYKNNSTSKEAIKADEMLKELKAAKTEMAASKEEFKKTSEKIQDTADEITDSLKTIENLGKK